MKARIKATGEIIEISEDCSCVYAEHYDKSYNITEVEFLDVKEKSFPKDNDYWTRLEHQAAIAAMQGLVTRGEVLGSSVQEIARDIAEISCEIAHALVEKMKEERK